jgi:formylglycine-generating enzyme required for sulfatase activity
MTNLLTLEQRHERAERQVNRFVDRFEPSYHDLVCHAALPLILTPELVSYLRNEFLREVPWIAEVDLLLSDLCSPVGYELYVMDADVRAYALTECSATFTADRKREVANLLISYVRYLAEHQSYLSDRELESQQWAAMLYLGEAERQTVVSELVERFQSAETGGTMVGANLLDQAEIARLAQLTQTLKPQLAGYPELIKYAALVSDVQLRNIMLERSRIEKTYVVAPGQFLRLPAALQTELVAKNRIQDEPTLTQPVASQPVEALETTSSTSALPPFPPLEPFEFVEAQLVDDEPEPPSNLERFNFTIATLERGSSQSPDQQPGLFGRIFSRRTDLDATTSSADWLIRQRPGQARRFIQRLDHPRQSATRTKGRKQAQANPPDLALEMVYIPGGTFLMGSPKGEPERLDREGPPHDVTVPPFFMGRYPITQAQWRAVARLPQVERALEPAPSRFKGDNRPVEQVSWYDAVEFCARLSAHTGRPYRLPTEAEWEYACRAGTTTPFAFGETLTTEIANYNGDYTYANGPKGEYRRETTPVDHFGIANAFGLSDMHGNVYEWCQDHWHSNYEGAPVDGSAWLSEDEGVVRILRGGSWIDYPRNCRSAYRFDYSPRNAHYFIGFRVVSSAPWTL